MLTVVDQDHLQNAWQGRKLPKTGKKLGALVETFLKKQVVPRQKKFTLLARTWQQVLPPELVRHSCLDSFSRGQLKVLVDSAAHLHELDLMIREGLLDQLRQLCPSVSLRRIKLLRGNWYQLNEEGLQIVQYKETSLRPTSKETADWQYQNKNIFDKEQ